ncbi:LPXTG cell wall anchor domain-containing protein [Streptomyces sp. NPDC059452]|uniref:LPXTG cell wall anchor domain-containing protein n=1 Tax=Streptomyces sp. NPDC059452 TaxID=3346835 RepID=UPI0036A02118
MKIRRTLATAVAVAVTTPAVMLSVTPAFADTKPVTQPAAEPNAEPATEPTTEPNARPVPQTDSRAASQTEAGQAQAEKEAQGKPTLKELEKAAADAQKAYDDAVAAERIAYKVLEEALSDTAPLTVAAKAAQKAADDAAVAKTTADKAVTDAKAALDALTEEATEEERTAAEKTLAEAETAAKAAETAKSTADADAKAAGKLAEDARVEANKTYDAVKAAVKDALDAKTAADAALARAKEEEDQGGDRTCVDEPRLTTVATGFPSSVTAGTRTTFSVRVTNGTDKELDEVLTYAGVHGDDKAGLKDIGKYLKLKWSTKASPEWKDADNDSYFDAVGALKPGAQADIKLRLDVDAKAPAGQGLTLITGGYFNEDGACGFAPDDVLYEFDIKAAAEPAAKPSPTPTATTPAAGSGVTPQGSGSSVPVATTGGTLAATGSSDATTQIALAGGAAVLLGAGAMFVVRRRKAGADA